MSALTVPRRRSPHRIYTLVLFTFIVCTTQYALGNDDTVWPFVYLRTATIDTRAAATRSSFAHHRRILLQQEHHTDHGAWGNLHGAHQALFSYQHQLTHEAQASLIDHIEEAGARVMGYVPQDTFVVMGTEDALRTAANHSHVLWWGLPEPAHKIAPEWHSLVEQIDAVASHLGDSVNASISEAQSMLAAAALEGLPVRIERRPGVWPLVGIRVVFPVAWVPKSLHESHPAAAATGSRARRVLKERSNSDPGTAAAFDWTRRLQMAFREPSIEVHPGGISSAVVLTPPAALHGVIEWLAAKPAVRWVAPLPRHFKSNHQGSVISQANRPAPQNPGSSGNIDPSIHPIWAAGITGTGLVVGQGDSGIDHNHCFFTDPNVDWNSSISVVSGVPEFQSTTHRKIRMYRAYADFVDANGHGSHTAGTLAGIPYGTSIDSDGPINIGMAPDAKIAFIDLSSAADGDTINTPYDLAGGYFKYTSDVGAAIHSDSWGSNSIVYDSEAVQVDAYCWENPNFLPVFPAGNDGLVNTPSGFGSNTVNSPATAKNCIAAGATQTTGESVPQSTIAGTSWTATVTSSAKFSTSFRVLQSAFSPGFGSLGSSQKTVVAASPLQACSQLTNPGGIAGAVALVERGGCTYLQKAQQVIAAGAAACIIFDDVSESYFVASSSNSQQVSMPLGTIPRRLGQNMMAILSTGLPLGISFAAAPQPAYGFENLASFSSKGPVGQDYRIKPDLVATGTLVSAQTGSSCGTVTYGGTSMATPGIAGSALLVKQYFEGGYFPSGSATSSAGFTPTSALIKAALVAGAVGMNGYEADTGLPIDPPPSFSQGFGRIFLGQSLFLQGNQYSPKQLAVVDAVPIASGDVHQYCITAGGGALSVALVWTDYPGDPSSTYSLVNDLNLVVRAEGLNGQPLLGNGGDVEDSTKADRSNNIETVTLPSLPPGRVAVEVHGASIQAVGGAQHYALVINGDFQGTVTPPSSGSNTGQCSVVVATIASGPSGPTNQSVITFTLGTTSGSSNGVSFECQLSTSGGNVGPPGTSNWTSCSSPVTYNSLPDGSYTFSVRASGEAISSSSTFTKDTVPPVVSLSDGGLPSSSATSFATMSFSATDITAVTFTCSASVNGASPAQGSTVAAGSYVAVQRSFGQWFNCTSPFYLTQMLPGNWQFQVVGTDAAGNSANPLSVGWTVAFDSTQNYVRATGPVLTIPKEIVQFNFSGFGPSASSLPFECSLTPGGQWGNGILPSNWSACSKPMSYGQPADGNYTFAARVVGDPAAPSSSGDLPSTWAVSVFTIDSRPPQVNITSGPTGGAAEGDSAVSFSFEIDKQGSTAVCQLNAKDSPAESIPSSPCVSPVQFPNLTSGHFAFSVIPTDVVGNVGPPATADFLVDTLPPNVTQILAVVNNANSSSPSVTVTFNAIDNPNGSGIRNVTCRVVPVALAPSVANKVNPNDPRFGFTNCTSPFTFAPLLEGHWVVTVVADDNVGHSSAPATADVYVDTIAPVAQITQGPSRTALISGGQVTFTLIDSTDPGNTGFGSPVQWQGLLQSISDAQYSQYQGMYNTSSPINNSSSPGLSPSTGTSGGSVITVPTSPSKTSAPAPANLQGAAVSAVTGVGNITNYVMAATSVNGPALGPGDVGQWTNCSAQCTYAGLSGGKYSFQARGVDQAGNMGQASTPPYPIYLQGASKGLPTWALAVIIAGSCVVGLASLAAMWWWCCRRRPTVAHPPRSQPAVAHGAYGASATYPIAGATWYGANGGTYPHAPLPAGMNGYRQNGVPATHLEDPIEAQELALALAASKREGRTRGRPTDAEDTELRRALEASMREQRSNPFSRDEENAQMRAAIEASLHVDMHAATWQPSAPPQSADLSVEEWPPRRR